MASNYIGTDVSMIDKMEYYLTNDLQATSDEIDYIKRLYNTKTKDRGILKRKPNVRLPSTIVDNFLYHGHVGHAKNWNLLNEIGIKHILNICEIELNKEILDNFNVLWINIDDDHSKVFVHCQLGISRSSSIVLAYLMKYHHENLIDAYDHLVNCRRIASPNFGFFLQLIRYEKTLHKFLSSNESHGKDKICQ
ncbi:unnamed protein product [Adineta steineri]|uniref:protein-tyrosine-phosphatase n=1 Tax=Adineta steineri TaxID=433720 RepID=A0A814IPE1_9BILA|nr:unnamed protein product [Adineta steineri]CAF1024372.1 unnamed protein product [Adineta steineri]CAF1044022.1 unnamed protein product [Adineta steineri]CAF1044626.1 unnamed protein product [Adineta steineri]